MRKPSFSIFGALVLLAGSAVAQIPGEGAPLAQAPANGAGAAPRRVRRHSTRKVSQYALDKKAVYAAALTAGGGLKTPPRAPEAQGYTAAFKAAGPGRYFATGLLSDFSPAAQAAIRARLDGIAGAGRASGRIAKGLTSLMDAGTPALAYVEAFVTVDPSSRQINVASVKKMRNLSGAQPVPASSARAEFLAPAPAEAEPVIPTEAPRLPDNARMGPTYAKLPGEAPGAHSIPEPLAIGREAVNMPTLTAEQRIGVRDFAAGPLTVFVKAIAGSGKLRESAEKLAGAAETSSLFINPSALAAAIRRLTDLLENAGQAEAGQPRYLAVTEELAAVNRQLSTAGIYLNVIVNDSPPVMAEAYVLRGKQKVDVYGSKAGSIDLRHITGPAGWYGYFVPHFDVPAGMAGPSKEFAERLGAAIVDRKEPGQIMSRPNGLLATVQTSWAIETLVRKSFGGKPPEPKWAGGAWMNGVLLHQAFHSYFRKNGGTERAARASNADVARSIEEQGADLYQLSMMDPKMVPVAVCVIADRALHDDSSPETTGARRAFESLQNESGVQMLDPKGRLKLEGVQALLAMHAEFRQQTVAAAFVREIVRVYLPGTY